MQKNSKLFWYFAVNIVFVVCALFFVDYKTLWTMNFGLPNIVWILLLFLLMHVARFVRMYFILLEDLIRPNRFLQLYVKTTFVSSLIPFKIGELFKMYCYGVETNSAMKGVTAVVIEKFFDGLVLCCFMLPYVWRNEIISPLLVVLLVFVLLVSVLYFAFDGTYRYLNRFLVCRGGGRKSVAMLKTLEGMKVAYDGAKRTLRGRFILLLFLSILAWCAEGLLIALTNIGSGFDFGVALSYVSDGFFGVTNASFNYYTCLCAVVFFVTLVIIYGKKYLGLIKEHRRS